LNPTTSSSSQARHGGSRLVCLGIESTAHTFGASIATSEGRVLADVSQVYKPPLGSGIHPREASRHHGEVAPEVIRRCLRDAKIGLSEIDLIAFSAGPGLGPALRVGATIARALAVWLSKPLVPVHHAIGHVEIGALSSGARDPLVILVSGGHTAIVAYADRRWRIFGETEDITLGNLLDMFARSSGLPSPGGPAVEELAREGSRFVPLPYVVKGNDVSYSGLLTAAEEKAKQGLPLREICFSLQEVAFAMLAEASERALAHTGKGEVLLAGGVAANRRLAEMVEIIASEHGARFYVVEKRYSGDCGAQIAWTGLLSFQGAAGIDVAESFVKPKWRLDMVDIPWRR